MDQAMICHQFQRVKMISNNKHQWRKLQAILSLQIQQKQKLNKLKVGSLTIVN